MTHSLSTWCRAALLLAALLTLGGPRSAQAQGTELFISEYDEGAHTLNLICPGTTTPSQANEKAIEIYNPTTSTVSLAPYSLRRYVNGSLMVVNDERLLRATGPNTLAPGAVFVIRNPDAIQPQILATTDQVASGFNSGPNATVLTGGGPIYFNGDDAMALVRWSGGVAGQGTPVIVDIFGVIGHRPTGPSGMGYWTATDLNGVYTSSGNQSLRRRAGITTGSTTWNLNVSPALDPALFSIADEWEMYSTAFPVGQPADPCGQSYADLGQHNYTGPHGPYGPVTAPAPTITGFTPAAGAAGTTVTLTGTNLTGATGVTVGNVAVTSFSVNPTGTAMTLSVPAGALAGAIGVTTLGGTAASIASFCVRYTPSGSSVSRCGSGSVVLTAASAPPGGSYRWYSTLTGGTPIAGATGATFTTPVLSATTTYYVAVVAGMGAGVCEGSRVPAIATIRPIPTVQVSAGGTTTFCQGGSVTLTAAGAGAYQWSTGATTPSITVTSSGTYTVTGTSSSGCAATPVGTVVSVLPVPLLTSATGAARCGPGALTLTAAGVPAGSTYRWYTQATGGTPIPGATSATFTTPALSATTPFFVTAVGANGCEGPRLVAVATIDPVPTATLAANGPTTFCPGGAVLLTATGSAGGSYQFALNGVPLPNATGTTFLANQGGVYTVILTTGPCATTSAPVPVTVDSAPLAPTITVTPQPAGTVLLTSSAVMGSQWYLNGVPIPGATGPTYTVTAAAQNGAYTVVATSAAGCGSPPSAAVLTTVSGLPAAPSAAPPTALTAWPNPARAQATVSGAGHRAALVLLDATGRQVGSAVSTTDGTATLEVAALPRGVYVVRTAAGRTCRLVVE